MPRYRIARSVADGVLDDADVEPTGIVRLSGWCPADPEDLGIALAVNGDPLRPFVSYRTYRPDVALHLGREDAFLGFAAEYRAGVEHGSIDRLDVNAGGKSLVTLRPKLAVVSPPYDHLYTEARTLSRDGIYGYGPPAADVAPEVLALTATLSGPVLDFGCGSGALVGRLRESGVEAVGLELDRPGIAESLAEALRPYIHLYGGGWPTPFSNGSFRSVTAIEVLEHLPEPAAALEEIRRVTRERFVATVPDMSAIPVLSRHGVVPWHLLESTHLSFFTQASFTALVSRFFEHVEVRRIGRMVLNDTVLYTGLAVVCHVKPRPAA